MTHESDDRSAIETRFAAVFAHLGLIEAYARRRGTPPADLDDVEVAAPEALSPPTIDLDAELEAALAALSAADREALLLVAWEDLTPAAAAASLGISASAFRVRLHRARRRLLYELETRGHRRRLENCQPSASPKTLFEADPAGQYSRLPGQITKGTGQTVIPSTVRLATTFTVPRLGRFQWWIALSKPNGWLCGAIRQPDGTWADLKPDKYQLSGPVPGCGTLPWHDAHGFAYNQSGSQSPDGRVWRIAYGYAPTTGHPVEIRDKVSGATVPIGDGRYFAIVMPQNEPGYQLQTLDRAGRVLVTDQRDPGE